MMAKPFTVFAHECKKIPDFAQRLEGAAKDGEQFDMVQRPQHYCKGGIECIDVIKAATQDLTGMEAVCTANIIKYIFRWKDKNGIVDVKKCKWYVERLIQELENKQ